MSGGAAPLAACRDCPRLAKFLDRARCEHPGWHNAPVPAFGDAHARLLVVGLAPGKGGANRTGRPFSGDASGEWLWSALHREGFASAPVSAGPGDGLSLTGAMVTNAVKCVPPGNRPTRLEVANCRRHLDDDLAALPDVRVVVALGKVAHDAWLARMKELRPMQPIRYADHPFAHGALHRIQGSPPLLDSFHPSPLNTRTGRLSRSRWQSLWKRAAKLARSEPAVWWVYVARCGDGTLYTGVTNDLARRRALHEAGAGAKYTRGRGRIEIVHAEPAASKGAALSREYAIKQLPRAAKLALGSPRGGSF